MERGLILYVSHYGIDLITWILFLAIWVQIREWSTSQPIQCMEDTAQCGTGREVSGDASIRMWMEVEGSGR